MAAAIWRASTELSDLAALDKCRIDLVIQLVGITMIQDLEIPVNPKHHSDRLRVWHSFLRQSDSATNISSALVEDLRQMDPAQADENRARHRHILVEATQCILPDLPRGSGVLAATSAVSTPGTEKRPRSK